MNFLLDTHILLWWLADDSSLSNKIKGIMSDENNIIFVSAASGWEIVIKKSIGKLQAPDDLDMILKEYNFTELPMSLRHATVISTLPNLHNDPFDRMLIAQAIAESLILITADEKIFQYNVPCIKA